MFHGFRLCGDAGFVHSIRQHGNALATNDNTGAASGVQIFTLVSIFQHIIILSLPLLVVSVQM